MFNSQWLVLFFSFCSWFHTSSSPKHFFKDFELNLRWGEKIAEQSLKTKKKKKKERERKRKNNIYWVKWSEVKSLSCVLLFATPWTAYQAPPSMGFSRQEYWSGLPFSSPGDLPNPGIELGSPAVQTDALPSEPPEKPYWVLGTKYHVGLSHLLWLNHYHKKFLT